MKLLKWTEARKELKKGKKISSETQFKGRFLFMSDDGYLRSPDGTLTILHPDLVKANDFFVLENDQ